MRRSASRGERRSIDTLRAHPRHGEVGVLHHGAAIEFEPGPYRERRRSRISVTPECDECGPLAAGDTGVIVSRNMIRRANQAGQQWYGGMNIYGSGVVVANNNVHDCKGVGIGAYGSNLLIPCCRGP